MEKGRGYHDEKEIEIGCSINVIEEVIRWKKRDRNNADENMDGYAKT